MLGTHAAFSEFNGIPFSGERVAYQRSRINNRELYEPESAQIHLLGGLEKFLELKLTVCEVLVADINKGRLFIWEERRAIKTLQLNRRPRTSCSGSLMVINKLKPSAPSISPVKNCAALMMG